MQGRWLAGLIGIGLLAVAPAGAALLPLQATYSLAFPFPGVAPVSLSGTGIGSSDGFGSAFSIPGSVLAGNAKVVVPVSPTFIGLTSLSIPANSVNHAAKTFNLDGALGISGYLHFRPGATNFIPLYPLGGGGTSMAFIVGLPFKVGGGKWQYGLGKVFTGKGAALSNALSVTATAFDNRTAGGRGSVQLVAGGYFLISGGALGNIPLLSTLTLTYTPEPGTLLLLGTGIAALAALGRSKVR